MTQQLKTQFAWMLVCLTTALFAVIGCDTEEPGGGEDGPTDTSSDGETEEWVPPVCDEEISMRIEYRLPDPETYPESPVRLTYYILRDWPDADWSGVIHEYDIYSEADDFSFFGEPLRTGTLLDGNQDLAGEYYVAIVLYVEGGGEGVAPTEGKDWIYITPEPLDFCYDFIQIGYEDGSEWASMGVDLGYGVDLDDFVEFELYEAPAE